MAFGDEDLDAIFSSGDPFAVLASFAVSGNTVQVYGQFTDGTGPTTLFGLTTEATDASITCRTSDIASVRSKMKVTIDTVQYTVERIEKSGAPGFSVVYLKT